MDEFLDENLPRSGLHDLLVVAAVVVGKLGRKQFVVGAPHQTALRPSHSLELRIGHHEHALDIFRIDQRVGVVQHPVEHPPLLTQRRIGHQPRPHFSRERCGLTAYLQLADHLGGQDSQLVSLHLTQSTGRGVEHAQCPQDVAVSRNQRGPGVEAQVRVAGHQRIVGEARIQQGVGNLEDLGAAQGMRAE